MNVWIEWNILTWTIRKGWMIYCSYKDNTESISAPRADWRMKLPFPIEWWIYQKVEGLHTQKGVLRGYWYWRKVGSMTKVQYLTATARSAKVHGLSLSRILENIIGSSDHMWELLQDLIMCRNLADAHEEVFETLNVDAHDLWNEVTNLFILRKISKAQ